MISFAENVLGLQLLEWQKWLLIHALELLPDGTPRFRTVVVLVARQNGKSTVMQILALYCLYVVGVRMVISTAQNLDVSEETWSGAVEMAQAVPDLDTEIKRINLTNGKKSLELASKARWKVQAGNRRGGRSLAADLLLLDELREHLSWDSWAAVSKTMMARPDAQAFCASNAGDLRSVVLSHLRRIAHSELGDPDGFLGDSVVALPPGVDIEGADGAMGWFEWSARPDRGVWDTAGWREANPALGVTITPRAIASAARVDLEPVFRTEVLCQWVADVRPDRDDEINPTTWARCADPTAAPSGRLYVGIDAAPGMASASITVCGASQSGGPVVELIRRARGASWLVDTVAALIEAQPDIDVVALAGDAPVSSLLPDLHAAGVPVTVLDARQAARGITAMTAAVTDQPVLAHRDEKDLNAAVAALVAKGSGDTVKWSRVDSTGDISPLFAAMCAHWAWVTNASADYDPLESAY